MKTGVTSVLSVSILTLGLGCLGEAPRQTAESAGEPVRAALRGGVTLTLKPGTTLDDDELSSRNGYGATLVDANGTGWFTRVEAVDEQRLIDLGLKRSSAAGRDIVLGGTTDEDGGECHVFLPLGDGRAVALSRVDGAEKCPTSAEAVAGWLPGAEVLATDAAEMSHGLGEARGALSYGTSVGSFDGVDAYSNGSNTHVSGAYSCCGMEWQCVEYVNRYYVQRLGHTNLKGTGHARSYFATASSKGLVAFANESTTPPAVGDMLVSEGRPGSESAKYGHIALVREVGPSYVKVIHQNWANDSSDNEKTLSMSVSGGSYTVSGFSQSYPVTGWLRRPESSERSVCSVTPSTAWLGTRTTFTVEGDNLPPTLAAWIADCADLVMGSVTPTRATFTCTPSWTPGPKAGVVKTRSGGTVLKDFTVTVR